MTHAEIKSHLQITLSSQFNADEIHAFLFWILPHLDSIPSQLYSTELNNICDTLLTGKPIQHILETAFFGDLTLKVNSNTLIPRPETEELCHLICSNMNSDRIAGLDIGTGSGCIPIYLLNKNLHWSFRAIDISQDALVIANENAYRNGLQNRIAFECSDFLTWTALPTNINLLVSNPPYITVAEKEQMQAGVTDFEPHLALFTPEADPLVFYKHIAFLTEKAAASRTEPLEIWLEINQYLGDETKTLFNFCHFNELICDLSGNQRFIHAVLMPALGR